MTMPDQEDQPRPDGSARPDKTIGPIRFDPALYDALVQAARIDGRTLAGYIRRAVQEKMSRDEKKELKDAY